VKVWFWDTDQSWAAGGKQAASFCDIELDIKLIQLI